MAKLNQWQGAHSSLCLPPDLAVGNPAEASPGSSRQQLSVLVQLQAEALSSPKSNTAAPAIIPPVSSAYPPLPTDNCRQHRRRHRQRQRRRRSERKSGLDGHERGRDWTRCKETGVWRDPPARTASDVGGQQLLAPMVAQVARIESQLELLRSEISTRNAELEQLQAQVRPAVVVPAAPVSITAAISAEPPEAAATTSTAAISASPAKPPEAAATTSAAARVQAQWMGMVCKGGCLWDTECTSHHSVVATTSTAGADSVAPAEWHACGRGCLWKAACTFPHSW